MKSEINKNMMAIWNRNSM